MHQGGIFTDIIFTDTVYVPLFYQSDPSFCRFHCDHYLHGLQVPQTLPASGFRKFPLSPQFPASSTTLGPILGSFDTPLTLWFYARFPHLFTASGSPISILPTRLWFKKFPLSLQFPAFCTFSTFIHCLGFTSFTFLHTNKKSSQALA